MHEMWKKAKLSEITRKCTGPEYLPTLFGKVANATFGRTRDGKKNGQARRSLDLLQKIFGLCESESGTKIDELLQAGAGGQ